MANVSKVLHGEGSPRIMIPEESNLLTGTVGSRSGYTLYLSGDPELTSAVLNRYFRGLNFSGGTTKGKIIAYNNYNKSLTIDAFDNLFPDAGKAFTIRDKVIDLPIPQDLGQWCEIVEKEPKELYYSRDMIFTIDGFRYYCSLDYGRDIKLNVLMSLQEIYDTARTVNFYFYPHKDNLSVNFKMEISSESFSWKQQKHYRGMMGVKLNFRGVELLDKIPLDSSLNELFGDVYLGGSVVVDD